MASTLTTMAERFVYLHEIGHVILHHHEGAGTRNVPGDWSAATEAVHTPEQEFEADLFSWQLLTTTFVGSPGELQFACAGATLFLRVAGLLEQLEASSPGATHPPASDRLSFLRAAAMDTGRTLDLDVNRVLDIDPACGARFDDLLSAGAPLPGKCTWSNLLEECAASPVPDYLRFQNEAMSVLSAAAPTKACNVLGHALAKAERELRCLGVLDGEEKSAHDEGWNEETLGAARRPLNNLKLMQGLVSLYLTPDIAKHIERSRRDWLRRLDA